jgi:hypothetical protein
MSYTSIKLQLKIFKKWGLRGRKTSPAGMDIPLIESLNFLYQN